MAGTSYTRQSTIADGNIISASLFNNEFNQILNAFAYASTGTTGHQHDGGAGEGGNIAKIGDQDFKNKIEVSAANNRIEFYAEVGGSPVEQVRIQDGAIVPVTDSDVDLGTTSVRFKDAFVDSATVTGTVSAATVTSSGTTNIVTGVVTGDLTLTGADYNIVFDASASELKFNDNAKLLIGTGNDLKIYHDGDNSRIKEQGVGGLYITADSFTSFGSSNGPQSLVVNNSQGLQALAGGQSKMIVDFSGVSIPDDVKLNFGDADDLQIYHDGDNSYIKETGTGNLKITAGTDVFVGTANSTMANFDSNGPVDLYHNNSKKFETTSSGVAISGNATFTGAATAQAFNAFASIDTPALEVTTLKARDGSAAGSIANSTGVVTLGSAVLTTADINGGTADNVVIGGSTAAAGTFTTGTIATADINGGAIDGTVIGGSTAAEGTFTAVTANNLKASSDAPYIYSFDTDVADSELRIGCFGVGTAYRARGGTSAFGAHQFTRFNGTDTHTVLSTNVGGDFLLHTNDGTANTKYNSSTGNLRIGSNSNSASKLKVDGEISSTNLTVDDKVRIGAGGSAGTYAADLEFRRQGNAKSIFTADCSGTTLTVTSVETSNSPIEVGDLFFGSNAEIQPNTFITALGTGTGGTGTYTISTTASFTDVSGLVNAPATANRIRFTSTDTFVHQGQPLGSIDFVSSDTTSAGTKAFIVAGHQEQAPSTYIAFGTNNNTDGTEAQEVARFDENGKLLIGALTTNDTLDHIELRDTGEIRSASLATASLTTATLDAGVSTFTKSGGSGTIAEFYNDTTRVGFIRDRSEVVSSLVLDPRENGVGISASANRLIPTDLNGNVTSNIADLGGADQKWKSLYLGGGVYLGGDTAAANKLEDYEEGTWGPVFRDEVTGGNVASGQAFNGSYTRIGNQCTLYMRIINLDPDTDVTGTNNVYITNLPFAASDESSNYRYVGSMESTRISYSGSIQPRITENTNYMVISKTNQSGSTSALQWDDITDNLADMYVSITYTV